MPVATGSSRSSQSDGLSREAALKIARAGHVGASGEFEWFTPPHIITAARKVMGGIDLDPASTPEANAIVGAERIYTMADDGLSQPWAGRVWMNPPYAEKLIVPFVGRLIEEVRRGTVEQACVLVNNATETAWFQRLVSAMDVLCLPAGRLKFWHPARGKLNPLQGQAIFYLGPEDLRFRAVFSAVGALVLRT